MNGGLRAASAALFVAYALMAGGCTVYPKEKIGFLLPSPLANPSDATVAPSLAMGPVDAQAVATPAVLTTGSVEAVVTPAALTPPDYKDEGISGITRPDDLPADCNEFSDQDDRNECHARKEWSSRQVKYWKQIGKMCTEEYPDYCTYPMVAHCHGDYCHAHPGGEYPHTHGDDAEFTDAAARRLTQFANTGQDTPSLPE